MARVTATHETPLFFAYCFTVIFDITFFWLFKNNKYICTGKNITKVNFQNGKETKEARQRRPP